MADVIPLAEFECTAEREHARIIRALRDLGGSTRSRTREGAREALPIAASGVEELTRRVGPWLH